MSKIIVIGSPGAGKMLFRLVWNRTNLYFLILT